MNFKPVQRVICVENPNGTYTPDHNGKGAGWKEGYVFEIGRIMDATDSHKTILWPTNNTCGIYSDYVKHATWKERYKK